MKEIKSVILLTRGKTLIAKAVQFFSWIYEGFGKNTKTKKMYNHAVQAYLENGKWWIQEALIDGISKHKLLVESEYWKNKNYVVKKLKKQYSQEKLDKAINWAKSVTGVRYGFEDILAWIPKSFTNKWYGETGEEAKKAMICNEFCEYFSNILVEGTFLTPWDDCPMNLYDDNNNLEFISNREFEKIVKQTL